MRPPRSMVLDRQLQFVRAVLSDDGFHQVETWANHGLPVWGQRTDVRDAEKVADGRTIATLMSRFVVRWAGFTEAITPRDRFTCDGRTWEVLGVKEGPGRRQWLELTAVAEV